MSIDVKPKTTMSRRLRIVSIPPSYVLQFFKETSPNWRVIAHHLPADAKFIWIVTPAEWDDVEYGLRIVVESSEFDEVPETQPIPRHPYFEIERTDVPTEHTLTVVVPEKSEP